MEHRSGVLFPTFDRSTVLFVTRAERSTATRVEAGPYRVVFAPITPRVLVRPVTSARANSSPAAVKCSSASRCVNTTPTGCWVVSNS